MISWTLGGVRKQRSNIPLLRLETGPMHGIGFWVSVGFLGNGGVSSWVLIEGLTVVLSCGFALEGSASFGRRRDSSPDFWMK